MTTHKIAILRMRARQKWKKGLEKYNLQEPTEIECHIFNVGFDMGYKMGKINSKDSENKELIEFRKASLKDFEEGRTISFTSTNEMNKWLDSF